jgi:hypothetical protein
MSDARGTPGSPGILLAVVAIALAIGASASLIAGAATAPAYHSGPIPGLFVTEQQLTWIFLISGAVFLGLAIWSFHGNRQAIPGRAVATVVTILLVMLLFVALFHTLGPSSTPLPSTPGNNSSSGPPPSTNTTTNTTQPGNVSAPGAAFGTPGLPSWLLFAGIAVAALIGVVILFPFVLRRSGEGGPRSKEEAADVSRAQGALAQAARELDAGDEPRQVVIRLYSTLLARVGPIVGGVAQDTPEEIRVQYLVRLGIRTDAASILTRLFEEARYSSHAMGAAEAAAAQQAILQARSDLDHRPVPAA